MTKSRLALTLLLTSITTVSIAQQTSFKLNGTPFIADTSFYQFGNVIRCTKKNILEEMPAAMCCHYTNQSPKSYYYTGENYTCPRINGQIGSLSYHCIMKKQQLRSVNNYAQAQLTIQSMIKFYNRKP